MADIRYIDKDFVRFVYDFAGKERRATLAFGDKVEFLDKVASRSRIKALELFDGEAVGTVKGVPFRSRKKGVLKFSLVDVQQGDGMILETPPDQDHETKIIFIDSGDNKLFARHAAARFRHRQSTKDNPLPVDLILITHGDGDHFKGLNEILKSEKDSRFYKRLFIKPLRIYHNGLVKGPSALDDEEMLGRAFDRNGKRYIVDLFDDPAKQVDSLINSPFRSWIKTIQTWEARGPIEKKRVAFNMRGLGGLRLYGRRAAPGQVREGCEDRLSSSAWTE